MRRIPQQQIARRYPGFPGLFLACLMGLSQPSQAGLRLCNQSFDVLNIALAMPHKGNFRSQGWWRVAPNQCVSLQQTPLESRFLYVLAADVFGNEVLFGATPMCIAPSRFEISLQGDCLTRGYLDARFLEVDTKEQTDWTIFVTPR